MPQSELRPPKRMTRFNDEDGLPGEGRAELPGNNKIDAPTSFPKPATRRRDRLTVFQAGPLVQRDKETDELQPIERLDFDKEREVLVESLSEAASAFDAEIEIEFETATVDRLAAFLGKGEGEILHFSCHGDAGHLCIEDGCGGAQFIKVEDLKQLMAAGRGSIRMCFVSACHSEAAGRAFVDAGCPHVLCCQQDKQVMNVATIVFAQNFYRALACGRSLQKSYDIGRQAVRFSPLVPDSEKESKKFVLLPEGENHDVPIFYTTSRQRSTGRQLSRGSLSSWNMPHPPRTFIGREKEMYAILQALQTDRLVRVTGPPGIGKKSLVSAVCQYINVRSSSTVSLDEIIWLPLIRTARGDEISSAFRLLFSLFHNEVLPEAIPQDTEYSHVCGIIADHFYKRKCLLVIEITGTTKSMKRVVEKVELFLNDFFLGTRHAKVVMLVPCGYEDSLHRDSSLARTVPIGPLTFSYSAYLFGIMCPHVSERKCPKVITPHQLWDLLVPEEQENVTVGCKGLSKKSSQVMELIGDGIPEKIIIAAKDMQPHEYDALIELGGRDEQPMFNTRAELEAEIKARGDDLDEAVRERSLAKAKDLSTLIAELMSARDCLDSSSMLSARILSVENDIDAAIEARDFSKACALDSEVLVLKEKLSREEESEARLNIQVAIPSEQDEASDSSGRKEDTHTIARSTDALKRKSSISDGAEEERSPLTCESPRGVSSFAGSESQDTSPDPGLVPHSPTMIRCSSPNTDATRDSRTPTRRDSGENCFGYLGCKIRHCCYLSPCGWQYWSSVQAVDRQNNDADTLFFHAQTKAGRSVFRCFILEYWKLLPLPVPLAGSQQVVLA